MGQHDVQFVATSADVEKQLDKLAENVRVKALSRAMGKALTPAVRIAKRLVPVRSGITKNAIIKKVRKYSSGVAFGLVGVDATAVGTYQGKRVRPEKIFHLIEGGTKRHSQPKRRMIHPGAKAHPVIRPAREQLGTGPIEVFAKEVWNEVEKLQAKAGQ